MRHFVRLITCPLFFFILLITLSLPALAATTIHVPRDQPTIQAGINAAINGDTVLVSPGTYFENINFNGKAITVTSSKGPVVTIIDGQQLGPVVEFATSEARNSVLRGFTVQNGNGYINNSQVGGGIDVNGASPSITGNVIWQNNACFSGGAIAINNGSPLIQRNIIDHNSVPNYCGSGQGAITIFGASSGGDSGTVVGNLIHANTSEGVYAYGSGPMLISGNIITNNTGIGIAGGGFGQLTITQNLITANQNLGAFLSPPATIVNNTVVANAYYFGGGNPSSEVELWNSSDQVILDNNLIIAVGTIPAFSCQYYSSAPVMNNNDVFAASAQAYSVCPDVTGTSGNISADPIFADLLGNNFHLQGASPAIDAGDNSAPGLAKSDFDGDPRILNNIVDIGIDEYSKHSRLTLSSYSLYYGTTAVGSISSPQIVTLTNQGTGPVGLNWIGTGTDYSQTNTCGKSIAAGANCQITVTFAPIGGGTRQGALGLFTSATSNPLTVFMTGFGLAPQISLPNSFYFAQEVVGTTGVLSGTVTNIGQAPLSIHNIVLSGTDFVESNDCPIAPNTLAINAFCTVTVFYTPTIVGSESATITLNDNVLPNLQTVSIIGYSVSAGVPSFSPASLTFPATLIGQSSAPQISTLTNTGAGPLGISFIFSTGDFQETNNCPTSLGIGASCALTVTYTPSSGGVVTGSIFVYTDGAASQAILTATGTGQAPVPTISSLSISSLPVGSADSLATITGTGFVYGSQVLWNGVALTGYIYVSGHTQINFTIPASDLATVGAAQVSVFTPAPGGGTSNAVPFTVYTPVNYAESATAYSYTSITGTNLNLGYFTAVQITPPFPIQFGGASFANLTIGSSGAISFNGFSPRSNDVIPTTQTPMLVAPFWAELYAFGSGTNNNVFWEVLGTAPNRQLVIEWRNVGMCCEATNTIKFEVVFFEGNSNILFNYADTIFGGGYSYNDNGATASSGVQVASALGTQFSYYQPLLLSKTAQLWYPSSPTAMLSTSTIGFGYHQIGTSTLPQPITLTNGGLVPLNISSLTTDNPDFTQTNTCGATVQPGASCTIQVTFKPTQPYAETAMLTIVDNGSNSPQTIAMTGIGTVTSTVVYPAVVSFGSVTVGAAATAPVTLANASNSTMTIQSITTAPTVYTETNNCGSSLAPGLSCTINVTFKPAQKGSISGTLSMGLNGKAPRIMSNLKGSGS